MEAVPYRTALPVPSEFSPFTMQIAMSPARPGLVVASYPVAERPLPLPRTGRDARNNCSERRSIVPVPRAA